jgi:undecaprenyl-diphosphatase
MIYGGLHTRYLQWIRFVRARFARGEYLGLHLTVGMVVSVLALTGFAVITRAVVQESTITRVDARMNELLHARGTLSGYAFWAVLSALGEGLTLSILGLGVALLLALRGRWVVLGGWAAALIGSGLLNGALKLIIRRPRPERALDFLGQMSWSFPSGHSMASFVTYGMLAYLLVLTFRNERRAQVAAIAAAAFLILSIGFSRMYLGVHYFSDVVGGYTAGALWLTACVSGLEISRRFRARTPITP